MKICYYDESGDDGFPSYSSPLFVLSAIYLDHLSWKETHERIIGLRRSLKADFDLPVKMEMHTKQFLLDKSPYRERGISEPERIEIMNRLCSFVGDLDIKIINVLINKTRINYQGYDVLNKALTFSVQRIENDIDPGENPEVKFFIITDEGRVGKMRKTTRAIQRFNYIPSQYSSSSIRKEIQALIEDPLPKDSKESYFIQIADLVAYLVYLYGLLHLGVGGFPNRMTSYVTKDILINWLNRIKPSFNLAAAPANEFGVMIHPK